MNYKPYYERLEPEYRGEAFVLSEEARIFKYIFTHPEEAESIVRKVSGDILFDTFHRELLNAIIRIHENGKIVDFNELMFSFLAEGTEEEKFQRLGIAARFFDSEEKGKYPDPGRYTKEELCPYREAVAEYIHDIEKANFEHYDYLSIYERIEDLTKKRNLRRAHYYAKNIESLQDPNNLSAALQGFKAELADLMDSASGTSFTKYLVNIDNVTEDAPESIPIIGRITEEEDNLEQYFYRHDYHLITGKSGSKKSWFIGSIAAAAINGSSYAHSERTLGFKATEDNLNILWVNTEMSDEDINIRLSAVKRATGDTPDFNKRFSFLNIQGKMPQAAKSILYEALPGIKPDILLIDSIRSLCEDYNSPQEAVKITAELQDIAKNYNCCVICSIHQNQGDNMAKGHLGKTLIDYSGITISLASTDGAGGAHPSKVTFDKLRHKKPESFAFYISDLYPKVGEGDEAGSGSLSSLSLSLEDIFTKCFEGEKSAISSTTLYENYRKLTGNAYKTARNKVSEATKKGILTKLDNKVYCLTKNSGYMSGGSAEAGEDMPDF